MLGKKGREKEGKVKREKLEKEEEMELKKTYASIRTPSIRRDCRFTARHPLESEVLLFVQGRPKTTSSRLHVDLFVNVSFAAGSSCVAVNCLR